MSKIRRVLFSDGFSSETTPSSSIVTGSDFLVGAGVPSAGLGKDGDYYLQSDSGQIYLKTTGSWSVDSTMSLPASIITNIAAGNIVATDIQTAINELDTEKLALTGGTISGSLTVSTDLTVTGDLQVDGTTTTLNTATLDVEDANITVNNAGSQATADSNNAGITVEMSDATDVEIGYDSTLTSRFAIGDVGSTKEIADVSSAQTFTNKQNHLTVTTETTTATIANTTDVVLASDSGGDYSLTLPAASGITGKVIEIKKTTDTTNTITIDGNASETIDGDLTTTINTQNEVLRLVSDGTNWEILERRIPSIWTSFTPTGGWTANITYTGRWRRVGDSMEIQYSVATQASAPTPTVTASFAMISGYTVDTAKLTATAGNAWGSSDVVILEAGQTIWGGNWTISGSTFIIYAGRVTGRDDAVTTTTPFTFGTGDFITAIVKVPITGWKG